MDDDEDLKELYVILEKGSEFQTINAQCQSMSMELVNENEVFLLKF
jgi:hypothetical protein